MGAEGKGEIGRELAMVFLRFAHTWPPLRSGKVCYKKNYFSGYTKLRSFR